MQDRYAGDIGDFGKFALLRALAPERRLGDCWCRTDGAGETYNDGRHLAYLRRPDRFRQLDSEVFEALASFVADVEANRCRRAVKSLEALALLPADTLFHGDLCPKPSTERQHWAAGMVESMAGADLVFLDPDNGLEEPSPVGRARQSASWSPSDGELGIASVPPPDAARRWCGRRGSARRPTARRCGLCDGGRRSPATLQLALLLPPRCGPGTPRPTPGLRFPMGKGG